MTQGTQAAEVVTAHQDVHSEQGAMRGEHPGRAKDPVIKARGLAWLEFEKTDLDRTELFVVPIGGGQLASRLGEHGLAERAFAGTQLVQRYGVVRYGARREQRGASRQGQRELVRMQRRR